MNMQKVFLPGYSPYRLVCALVLAGLLAGCGPGGALGKGRKGIITMGPHITETVFALEQGHRVIAVGAYDDFPPAARLLPKVGGYIDPDLEKITALTPELLIVAGKNPRLTEYAETSGLPILNLHMDSLDTIDAGIGELGEALGCARAANRLREKVAKGLDEVREAVKDLPRPKVLIITGRQSHDLNALPTAGRTSFVSELVELAGGENIYANEDKNYFEASKETVVVGAPEVILEFHCGESLTERQRDAFILDWQALPTLPAVQSHRIHLILEAHALRPGPRVPEVARMIARILHSDVIFPS